MVAKTKQKDKWKKDSAEEIAPVVCVCAVCIYACRFGDLLDSSWPSEKRQPRSRVVGWVCALSS